MDVRCADSSTLCFGLSSYRHSNIGFVFNSRFIFVVYYESLKRALKTKTTYGYRCDERLKTNVEESTRLACTPLCSELEHLKIETRLTRETPVSEMGEYASVM